MMIIYWILLHTLLCYSIDTDVLYSNSGLQNKKYLFKFRLFVAQEKYTSLY